MRSSTATLTGRCASRCPPTGWCGWRTRAGWSTRRLWPGSANGSSAAPRGRPVWGWAWPSPGGSPRGPADRWSCALRPPARTTASRRSFGWGLARRPHRQARAVADAGDLYALALGQLATVLQFGGPLLAVDQHPAGPVLEGGDGAGLLADQPGDVVVDVAAGAQHRAGKVAAGEQSRDQGQHREGGDGRCRVRDRKSTRLNSSH